MLFSLSGNWTHLGDKIYQKLLETYPFFQDFMIGWNKYYIFYCLFYSPKRIIYVHVCAIFVDIFLCQIFSFVLSKPEGGFKSDMCSQMIFVFNFLYQLSFLIVFGGDTLCMQVKHMFDKNAQ